MRPKDTIDALTKKVVYFNEYNVRMDQATYFPLVSGLLRAYAETSPRVKDGYRFKPFIFHLDAADKVLQKYDEAPDVAAFSIAMWNEQLSLHIASEIKRLWPDCLIVFGGCQLPHHPEAYFAEHPFIDVGVRAEGEEAFMGMMERFLESRDFAGVPNVSYRHPETGAFVYNEETPDFSRDLDAYPSPYLEGLFDYMFGAYPEVSFQAIIETNRGCPFLCTFCYWGRGGTTRKYRYRGMDRLKAEINWCGRKTIRYLFNADSNFGAHKRDFEIAEMIVATKQKYGFPEKFRTCWGKNTNDKIFSVATLFHKHDLEKGITLSRQSNTPEVLTNIKRKNIKLDTYEGLQRMFNDSDVPVYTEVIVGLPGETYDSWRDGLEEILTAGLKNQLFVYQCEVYPNTDLNDPEYRKTFGIETQRIELREIHGSIRDEKWVPEYQDIVVKTNSMPVEDWRRVSRLSVLTMLMHSMNVGFYVLSYLTGRYAISYMRFLEYICERSMPDGIGTMFRDEIQYFDDYFDGLLSGHGRGVEMPAYGNIYWDVEETSFLRLSEDFDRFYEEFHELVFVYLREQKIEFDPVELKEVVLYQRLKMPGAVPPAETQALFSFNIPEYFASRFGSSPISVQRDRQVMDLRSRDFAGDLQRFARETILWGRKSGTIVNESDWSSLDRPGVETAEKLSKAGKADIFPLPPSANLDIS